MSTPVQATVLQASADVRERTFVDLSPDEAARLADILHPLPWLEGLITAAIIAPELPEAWLDNIWTTGGREKLTDAAAETLSSLAEDHFIQVCNTLFDEQADYRPFLGDGIDQVAAAAKWAAGFRFGIRLLPEPWEPLIENDDSRPLLASIFCLERDEDLLQEEKELSPFHGIPPAERDNMRRSAVSLLAHVVPALNAASVALDAQPARNIFSGPDQPYVRTTQKIGRNDLCPCGSGKKYKKCCRDRLEQNE